MSSTKFNVEVNPKVLRWAHESAGRTVVDVARKLGYASDAIAAWEAGRSIPAWKDIQKFAQYVKRPVAALLLPNPPKEPPPPKDYRKFEKRDHSKALSPDAGAKIRHAQWLAQNGAELVSELGIPRIDRQFNSNSQMKPDELARKARQHLGVHIEEQKDLQHITSHFTPSDP
jgi:transcriptional regulator with XRE-family HTH domain